MDENSGTRQGQWQFSNVYANGTLLPTYSTQNNDTYFALNDWLGTKRAEVSPDGCLETYASLPYGDDLMPNGNCPDAAPLHFTGKEHDTESGNDYFGVRYYASTKGRFLSPDPLGIASGHLTDPQSLNLYTVNNPLINIDLSGTECVWDDGSYDSVDDPDTGDPDKCAAAGGLGSTIHISRITICRTGAPAPMPFSAT